MAWWKRSSPPVESDGRDAIATISPDKLLSDYEIVDLKPTYVVAVEKGLSKKFAVTSQMPVGSELGVATNTAYGPLGHNDYNFELVGIQGLRVWDEMRRSDGAVGAITKLVKAPVLGARWFVQPASESRTDKRVAEFVTKCLFQYMTQSWPQTLQEILYYLDFGYYAFEKVFAFRDGKIVWQKWGPRHPMSIWEWVYDIHGGPDGAWMYSQTTQDTRIFVPIEKLLVFTNEKEAGNLEGRSIYRNAYKHWYYVDNLYKIDAIQKERHGIGIPVIKLPPNFSDGDRKTANELGEQMRTNEKAHVVLPPMWELEMLDLQGNPVDALASAKYHNQMIYEAVLAGFLGPEGSGDVETRLQIFAKATKYIADTIRDVINKWAIPELVSFNWLTVDEFPELRVRRIGETVDWRTLSFALRNLVGAGLIEPDDPLEMWLRDEMDLSIKDPETKRQVATPQGAPQAGPPRQSNARNSTQGKSAGSSRTGQDRSGG